MSYHFCNCSIVILSKLSLTVWLSFPFSMICDKKKNRNRRYYSLSLIIYQSKKLITSNNSSSKYNISTISMIKFRRFRMYPFSLAKAWIMRNMPNVYWSSSYKNISYMLINSLFLDRGYSVAWSICNTKTFLGWINSWKYS